MLRHHSRRFSLSLMLLAATMLAACDAQIEEGWLGYAEGEEAFIVSPQPGWLTSIEVERGANISVGDMLFTLDATRELAARDNARAAISAANAMIAQAEAQAAQAVAMRAQAEADTLRAEREYERQEGLVAIGATPRSVVETAEAALQNARARRSQAEAQRAQAMGLRAQAEAQIDIAVGLQPDRIVVLDETLADIRIIRIGEPVAAAVAHRLAIRQIERRRSLRRVLELLAGTIDATGRLRRVGGARGDQGGHGCAVPDAGDLSRTARQGRGRHVFFGFTNRPFGSLQCHRFVGMTCSKPQILKVLYY